MWLQCTVFYETSLLVVQYLILMGVIYMLLKTFSAGLVSAVLVLIVQFFHMTNIAYPVCFHLSYYSLAFIMVNSTYIIIESSFFYFERDVLMHISWQVKVMILSQLFFFVVLLAYNKDHYISYLHQNQRWLDYKYLYKKSNLVSAL